MTGEVILGITMLVVMLAAIFIGLPVSFTLLFLALAFGFAGLGPMVFDLAHLQTAFLSPPVAMSAYYLKQVVSEWNVGTIARGMRQFLAIQCVAIALVLLFPTIAMWLPATLERKPAGTEWDWMLDVWDANHLELIERGDDMTPDSPPGE